MSSQLIDTKWLTITPEVLTVDGNSSGDLQTNESSRFKVGMKVQIGSNSQPPRSFEIKRIVGSVISVGPVGSRIHERSDISMFLVADLAFISAQEQDRSRQSPDEVLRYVYEEEPTVAVRSHLVDKSGEPFGSSDNPLNTSLTYESLLPLLGNLNFLSLSNPQNISVSVTGNIHTLTYQEGGCDIATAVFDYTDPSTWNISLNEFINDDDCTALQDDDFTTLNLD